MAEQEGVIKFHLDHQDEQLPEGFDVEPIVLWRRKLMECGLVGQDPSRYDGYGFGNLSMRVEEGFLITGSQTGEVLDFLREHFAWVHAASPDENRLASIGQTSPSSESLTHAAVYEALPEANFVFHAHSPDIWRKSSELRLPQTKPVPYGTPEMAREVVRLLMLEETRDQKIFTMAGHEDGVMSFGKTAIEAGEVLLSALWRAQQ
ncbi:MAG: class II aldolase/adducin family protein [Alphaproteobacteria bacterium]|nr:MAG: class II aldolase/adducin family protein [Alphaproteobacteria bacterium]